MDKPISLFNVNGSCFGFNKISGEIIQFDSEHEAEVFCNSSKLYGENLFLNKVNSLQQDIDEVGSIAITIELNNSCNLDCVYCYQIEKDNRKEISEEMINMILTYISNVYKKCAYEVLVLRFIGGEPLLSIGKLLLCYEKFKSFCSSNQIQLYVHVDTNGTCSVSNLIHTIPNLDIVICLTEKNDHDFLRSGSYDIILSELLSLKSTELSPITIRYNVSHLNVERFENFLKFVRENLPHINSVATARIDDSHCKHRFVNQLAKASYAHWNSTVAIDLLIKYGFGISHCTRSSLLKCQGYSKYSCKIYSDGKVSVCDAMYHDKAILSINELMNNVSALDLWYAHIKKYSPFHDSECSHCINLVQCGGKQFCRGANEMCDYQVDFNEHDFIETYINHYQKGNAYFFRNMVQL